ncbi:MAG: BamA/TamA family outer membrane protein, partial [Bdellovibrionota bacterium]
LGTWFHLPAHFRVGALFNVEEWFIDTASYRPGGPFDPFQTQGFGGGRDLSLGGGIAWDTRDNEFFPNNGVLIEGRIARTDEDLGADFNFNRLTADFRAFWTPWRVGHIIAIRAYYDATWAGPPPFFTEPKLGGSIFDRGYREGRFRDRNALIFTAEYRFQIYGRLSGAVFGEMGQVAHAPLDFRFQEIKATGGGAIGYLIPPGKVLFVRLEVAGSEDGATVFLRFGHPF